MEIEILRIINEGIYPGLLMLIKSIVMLTVVLAMIVVPASLASIAWLCFEEIRRPLHGRKKLVPALPTADDLESLAALTALEESPVDDVATDFHGIGKTFPSRRWKPSHRQVSGVHQ